MSVMENLKEKFKEFKPTSWSIKNKTSIYLVIIFVSMIGILPVCNFTQRTIS